MSKKLFLTGIFAFMLSVTLGCFSTATSVFAAEQEDEPEILHYYSFEDTAEDAAGNIDGVPSQNDKAGSESGLPQYSSDVREGASGKSMQFGGSNFLWFQENIFAVDGDFTVSFWMKPQVPVNSSTARIISTGVWGGATPGILLGVNNNPGGWANLVNGVGKTEGEGVFNWSTAFPALNDEWRHVVAVFNVTEGYYKIFVNGKELQYQSLAGGLQPKSGWGETALGGQLDINSNTVAEAYTGYIDDLIVLKGAAVAEELDTEMFAKLSSADIQYDITFESGEGSSVSPAKVYWGGTLSELPKPVPTAQNMNFAGWALSADGNNLIDETAKFYKDTTLYAVYSSSSVTVSFVTNCDETLGAQTLAFNTPISEPAPLTKTGYVFDGWFSDEAFEHAYDFSAPVVQNITLYAKWHAEKVTVAFDTDGGGELASQELNYGETVIKPNDPLKEAHIFGGWFTDAERTQSYDFQKPVTEDVTLYALWHKSEYTVRFETNGGTPIEEMTVPYAQEFELPTMPEREGYRFVNWYTAEDFSEIYISAPLTHDLVLYANWEAEVFSVRFESNGGGRVREQTVKFGEKAELPQPPEKEGFVFGGWFTDEALATEYDFEQGVRANLVLYAKWTAKTTEEDLFGCGASLFGSQTVITSALLVGGIAAVLSARKRKNER